MMRYPFKLQKQNGRRVAACSTNETRVAAKLMENLENVSKETAYQLGYAKGHLDTLSTECPCCAGDEALVWLDEENSAFIDSKGEILVTVHAHAMKFEVPFCPKCGKKFA